MKQVTAENKAVDRIKSVFLLGLSSNFTTLVGLVLVWILLAKNNWVDGFWETLFSVLAFAPIFMGDAINHYCLGRLKLEHYKGWDDIQVTTEGRSRNAHNYHIFRVVSIVPAYMLAGVFISAIGAQLETLQTMKLAFLAAFALHFFRATWFLQTCVAPRLPGYGGRKLVWRTVISGLIFVGWFAYLWGSITSPVSKTAILLCGFFYFFLNAFLQPLPTRYSLLRPGKASKREAFFSVEVIDDDQLDSLENSDQIKAVAQKCREILKFEKAGNLRMPLLELPLFQSWGTSICDPEGKILLMILDSEVKRGVHRTIVSIAAENIYITTDFGAPQAKFPGYVKYQSVEKIIQPPEMLEKHKQLISQVEVENIKGSICVKLENFIKNMIKFLETDASTKRAQRSSQQAKITPSGEVNEPDKQ